MYCASCGTLSDQYVRAELMDAGDAGGRPTTIYVVNPKSATNGGTVP
jgi:hypothetical protein